MSRARSSSRTKTHLPTATTSAGTSDSLPHPLSPTAGSASLRQSRARECFPGSCSRLHPVSSGDDDHETFTQHGLEGQISVNAEDNASVWHGSVKVGSTTYTEDYSALPSA